MAALIDTGYGKRNLREFVEANISTSYIVLNNTIRKTICTYNKYWELKIRWQYKTKYHRFWNLL